MCSVLPRNVWWKSNWSDFAFFFVFLFLPFLFWPKRKRTENSDEFELSLSVANVLFCVDGCWWSLDKVETDSSLCQFHLGCSMTFCDLVYVVKVRGRRTWSSILTMDFFRTFEIAMLSTSYAHMSAFAPALVQLYLLKHLLRWFRLCALETMCYVLCSASLRARTDEWFSFFHDN